MSNGAKDVENKTWKKKIRINQKHIGFIHSSCVFFEVRDADRVVVKKTWENEQQLCISSMLVKNTFGFFFTDPPGDGRLHWPP